MMQTLQTARQICEQISAFYLQLCCLPAISLSYWPMAFDFKKILRIPLSSFFHLFEKSLWSKKKIQNLSSNLRTNFYDT